MSIFKYMFDNDWHQRRDIEDLREQQFATSMALAAASGGASEKWVKEIAAEVKELAATVHVLMQMLAEKGSLDVNEVERRVDEELKPKPKAKPQRPVKPPTGEGGPSRITTITDEKCTKCGIQDRSNEMVKVGNAWFCRPCARNP